MNPLRAVGLFFLAGGLILLFMGLIASDSIGDQLSKTFTGKFTERTTWFIVLGVASTVCGAGLALFGRTKER